ncbi:histidine kinase N-terminal domain-containing protein, partial [Actinoalloteichus caeruleus]|uniref:histidine kinase N-terminal domain-containing protein n=1 Tax=Actinoalloteichus cyanogriseus TaxID=2893586 RepID=UPI00054E7D36
MSTLSDLLAEHTTLSDGVVDHLQMVVAEWQLLSDLSFADFLLWTPVENADGEVDDGRFLCVAQARPTTAPTAHPEDLVGGVVTSVEHPQLRRAVLDGRICREEEPKWHLGVPVRRETIPVRYGNRVVAVLSRDTNLAMPRVPSPLEISYLGSASDLCQMVADGSFPTSEPAPDVHTSPRVGDGLIRLDATVSAVFA